MTGDQNYYSPWPWYVPQMPTYYGPFVQPVQGCICPPTSEQTCMNPACPRRGISRTEYR